MHEGVWRWDRRRNETIYIGIPCFNLIPSSAARYVVLVPVRWTRKNISTSVCVHGTSCTASLSCYVLYIDSIGWWRACLCSLPWENHMWQFCFLCCFIYIRCFFLTFCGPCISQLFILCTEKERKTKNENLSLMLQRNNKTTVQQLANNWFCILISASRCYCQSVKLINTVCL